MGTWSKLVWMTSFRQGLLDPPLDLPATSDSVEIRISTGQLSISSSLTHGKLQLREAQPP